MEDRSDEVGHAIEAVVSDARVDRKRVALFGASQAGWVLPLVAAQHVPEFVIALSPAINWLRQSRFETERMLDAHEAGSEVRADVYAYRAQRLALLDRGAPYAEHQLWYERVPSEVRPYFDEMSTDRYQFIALNYSADATSQLSQLEGIPTLLMQGGQDALVDVVETAAT